MIYVAIISSHRSQNVPGMYELLGRLGDRAHWYVGSDEGGDYEYAGVPDGMVHESGGLVASRNAALHDAFRLGDACVEVSDDLRKVQWTADGKEAVDTDLEMAVSAMLAAPGQLVGVAPTNNLFYYPSKPINSEAFCVGDLILVRPTDLRFDPQFTLKEDYDYTLQHLHKYGSIARVNGVLATFQHRSNPGGAVDYRTEQEEQANIARLKAKWPNNIFDNPRRPNEILMRWHSGDGPNLGLGL